MRAASALHVLVELPVVGDDRPAGRGELHEGEAAAQRRGALEQPLDGEEPLLDALRVVEAVDAHAEERVRREARARRRRSPGTRRRGAPSRSQPLGHSIEIG